jgi:hypothetical protein
MGVSEPPVSLLDMPAPPPKLPGAKVPVPPGEVFAIAQEYMEAGRLDAAERMLGHILAVAPEQPETLHLMGLVAHKRGDGAAALALLERSVAQGSTRPVHWRNLSEVCRVHVKLDRALAAGRRAVALDPAEALGLFNLAMVYFDRMELGPCIASARAALDLKPDLPQARMKLAQALLANGELAEGWTHYEWRYRIPGAAPLMPAVSQPQWDGSALGEQRLLLVADQGFGDVIQFARYLPWVMARCPNVVVACSPEIAPVLNEMQPQLANFTRWETIPPFAAYCPFSGLPRLHGTTLENIPGGIPYLAPDPERLGRWRARLDAALPAGAKRIGIAWAGRPTHNNDRNRSVALAALAPLGRVPGTAFVSLQKGPAAAQVAGFGAPLLNLDAEIVDFLDTAAIIGNLDLLVTVDTAIGHLAGAMGRPAWVMLPFAPDWRWLVGRADSPWYPSLRLFRPAAPRGWDGLIAQVADALLRFSAGAAA